MSRNRYRWGAATIDVHADDPDAARWLAAFVAPWLEIEPPGQAGHAVRLDTSEAAFSALGAAPIAAIVFPEIDPTCTGWSLARLAPEAGAQRLREAVYGIRAQPRPATVFEAAFGRPVPGETEAALGRLAQQLPLLRCRLGPKAYDGAAGNRTLLRELASAADATSS